MTSESGPRASSLPPNTPLPDRRRRPYATLEWRSWDNMRSRCTNPNHPHWDRYGGRGIRMCERWRSFANFLADMGARPPGTTLDRKDNDGNYEPANCRWATVSEQQNNKQGTRWIEHAGRRMSASEWERETGLPVRMRLFTGWDPIRAVTAPKGSPKAAPTGAGAGRRARAPEAPTLNDVRGWLEQRRKPTAPEGP